MLRLLADETARGVLAERARRAAAEFDWGRIAERHLGIYEAIGRRA